MRTFEYTITDPQGIHARPAGLLAELVHGMDSTITISRIAPANKLLLIMSLGVKHKDTITVTVKGGDEAANAAAVERFLKDNL